MKNHLLITFIVLISVAFSSCKTEIEEAVPSTGNADLTGYVALGSSYTAGVTDGALYTTGQQNSFPAILAKSFQLAGGGTFRQPDVNSETGINLEGNSKLALYIASNCISASELKTRFAAPAGDQQIFANSISAQGPFHNLGVPGTKAENFRQQTFSDPNLGGNKFFSRFAKNPGVSSLLSEAVSQNPTFFTLLIGQEDIYDYARNGGDEMIILQITSVAIFNNEVDQIINTLVFENADGAIANIPDPIDIPFFNTIPYDGLILTAAQAQNLNLIYLTDTSIQFQEGRNPYLVKDAATQSGFRHLKSDEMVLLSASVDSICLGYGSYNFAISKPWAFEDRHVLDQSELANIYSHLHSFNAKIKSIADVNGLAFVDLFDLFRQLHNGIKINGVIFNNTYLKGQVYSLDGFHPTPRGYALIANHFIDAINFKFGATLKKADPNAYPGIHFP